MAPLNAGADGGRCSTVSGNVSNGGNGGGSIIDGSTDSDLSLTNSTVSGNSADESGGGLFNGGTVDLNNVTVADNTADANGDGSGDAGGICNFDGIGATVTLGSTIVAGNTDPGG